VNPNKETIAFLLRRYIDGKCSPEEIITLDHYIQEISEEELNQLFSEIWNDEGSTSHRQDPFSVEERMALLQNILHTESKHTEENIIEKTKVRHLGKPIAWIAACCVAVIIGFFWLRQDQDLTPTTILDDRPYVYKENADDVAPGKDEAVIITEGGKTISLNNDAIGIISQEEGFQIVRLSSGEIQYQQATDNTVGKWHTVATPRGGQINFILPDGTKVWLNAASSLRFYSGINGSETRVHMQGEIYFEVIHAQNRKFIVESDFGEIEVLGTKFNVNTYDNTQIQTALLEGSIQLKTAKEKIMMVPHQLSTINTAGDIRTQYKDNINDIIAWTTGEFYFDDINMKGLAQHLSRWYNVDVQVVDQTISRKITGKIARNVQLSKMIDMLEYLDVDCSYTEGKLFINAKN